jgi:hypothetical protein
VYKENAEKLPNPILDQSTNPEHNKHENKKRKRTAAADKPEVTIPYNNKN